MEPLAPMPLRALREIPANLAGQPTAASAPKKERPFLTAQWIRLAMLNYRMSPEILAPFVPPGTELDYHESETYMSIVGFLFRDTRLMGWAIPWHREFPELNLRIYVRRQLGHEIRRGVVFLKEVCPRWAVSLVARWGYGEKYVTLPMRHAAVEAANQISSVAYQWRAYHAWNRLDLRELGPPRLPAPDSLAEFIQERYYGYCACRGRSTLEYRVAHPPWKIMPAHFASLVFPAAAQLYGAELGHRLQAPPDDAFVADGSPVTVSPPREIA